MSNNISGETFINYYIENNYEQIKPYIDANLSSIGRIESGNYNMTFATKIYDNDNIGIIFEFYNRIRFMCSFNARLRIKNSILTLVNIQIEDGIYNGYVEFLYDEFEYVDLVEEFIHLIRTQNIYEDQHRINLTIDVLCNIL